MSQQATNSQMKSRRKRYFLMPISVRTHRYSTIKLRWLAENDIEFLSEQLSIDQSPREFTALLLHHQLISPELSPESISSLQDRTLARIAWTWARHKTTIEKYLPEGTEPFEGFRTALKDYLEEQRRQLQETMQRFTDSSLASIESVQRAMGSGLIRQAQQSAASLARIFDTIQPTETLARMVEDQRRVIEQVWSSTYRDVIQPAVGLDSILSRHIAEVTQISKIAEQTLAAIPWEDINRAARIPFDIGVDFRTNFIDFSQSFNALSQSLPQASQFVLSHKPEMTRLPAVEYLYGATLFEAVVVEEPRHIPEESEKYQTELVAETEDALYVQLRTVDANLIPLWDGARHSLESDNPDRVRHATVSMRELLTHILHRLAPDEEVRRWNSDPSLYAGRPTRKTRLLYICRNVNHDPFTEFVKKDVEAMIAFIDLFQRGTHELVIPYTEAQVRALRARMEGVLHFLLEIAL